jgi:hypothetical protein
MRATFKIILFSRANKGGLRPVMLRVTFLRRARYYPLHLRRNQGGEFLRGGLNEGSVLCAHCAKM